MQWAPVTCDAVQPAGDRGDEAPPTFAECRKVLVRMAQATQHPKLETYVENLRTMDDVTTRPSKDVLRVMASELKVPQKVKGLYLRVEQLHSKL